jgi:hypothetical protein
MMNRRSRAIGLMCGPWLALIASCQEDSGTLHSSIPSLESVLQIDVRTQDIEDSAGPILGHVLGGRLSESGERFVVLDRYPPFVRVYGADGRLQAAFVNEGGGPGEARNPLALAVSGDSLVALVDVQRLSLFSIEGEFLSSTRLSGGFPAGIAVACGKWVVYSLAPLGGVFQAQLIETNLRLGELSVSLLPGDSVVAPRMGGFHLVGSKDKLVVRHDLIADPLLLARACDSSTHSEWEVLPGSSWLYPLTRPGDGMVFASPLGSRGPVGVGTLGDGVLIADLVLARPVYTQFTWIRSDAVRVLRVAGSHKLLDSRSGIGSLVQLPSHLPTIVVVSDDEFERAFLEHGTLKDP